MTKPVTGLTLALLCLVALIPIGARAITDNQHDVPFHIYAMIMFASGLANAVLWTYASFAHGVMRPDVPLRYRRTRSLGAFALPLVFGPLVLLGSQHFFAIMVPISVTIGLLRRVVLPRVLDRVLPQNPAESVPEDGPLDS